MTREGSGRFNWAGLPMIATVARLLCRELALENEYLRLENRILKSKMRGRIRFTDEERWSRMRAALAMGRKLMRKVVSIVKPVPPPLQVPQYTLARGDHCRPALQHRHSQQESPSRKKHPRYRDGQVSGPCDRYPSFTASFSAPTAFPRAAFGASALTLGGGAYYNCRH